MKIIVLGTSEFVIHCIRGLLDSGNQIALIVSLKQKYLPDNSIDMSKYGLENKINYLEVNDLNDEKNISILKSYRPDIIFSAWPKILKKPLLAIPKFGIIGSHPTNLPHNRGRHPLQWEIILGFSRSKLSFFLIDEGVDTGRLLLQIPYKIQKEDTIVSLNDKVNIAAFKGALQLGKMFSKGKIPEGVEQDHKNANYWRKRTRHDTIIDFRMSAEQILRTVRSFTLPYPCALVLYNKTILHVVKASIAQTELTNQTIQRMEPGRVIRVNGTRILVKSIDKVIELTCQESIPVELIENKYIYPPTMYLVEDPNFFTQYL
jgi:methionyl-tRNA formyltransferase